MNPNTPSMEAIYGDATIQGMCQPHVTEAVTTFGRNAAMLDDYVGCLERALERLGSGVPPMDGLPQGDAQEPVGVLHRLRTFNERTEKSLERLRVLVGYMDSLV